jgi:hypothetical protein
MNLLQRLGGAMGAAAQAFKENYVTSQVENDSDWDSFAARKLRYEMQWAAYENSLYRDIHSWAAGYRKAYQLYAYIRNVYNPTYRLVEFYRMMLWGGKLDEAAGQKGAIPFTTYGDTDDAKLRVAIAKLYRDSNWAVYKDIVTPWGAAMGDVGVRIVDDPVREQIRLELVHPSIIKSVELEHGFVKGYEVEYECNLPASTKRVKYLEVCERGEGDTITFKTYADGKPFTWYPEYGSSTWSAGYGFVPFVMIQHNNVGNDWGWAETHAGQPKFNEADDQASLLHDYIRKIVNPKWMFFGMSKPASNPRNTRETATLDRSQPGRESMDALYCASPEGKAQALVTGGINIDAINNTLRGILDELERDYPELRDDVFASAQRQEGVRTARQKIEAKVINRRQNYDGALVRCNQMAIAIGGYKNYEGYDGYDLASYDKGELNHYVSERPVFSTDKPSQYADEKTMWEAVKAAMDLGFSAETVLRRFGWTPKELEEMGTQKLAAIKLQQEDKVQKGEDNNPLKQ